MFIVSLIFLQYLPTDILDTLILFFLFFFLVHGTRRSIFTSCVQFQKHLLQQPPRFRPEGIIIFFLRKNHYIRVQIYKYMTSSIEISAVYALYRNTLVRCYCYHTEIPLPVTEISLWFTTSTSKTRRCLCRHIQATPL